MTAKKSRIIAVISAVACAMLLAIIFTRNINAEGSSSQSSITKKAYLQGLSGCVKDGFMRDIEPGTHNYEGLASLYVSQTDDFKRPLVGPDSINCYEIITGERKDPPYYMETEPKSVFQI